MFTTPHKKVLLPLPTNLTPKPTNVPNHEYIRLAAERGLLQTCVPSPAPLMPIGSGAVLPNTLPRMHRPVSSTTDVLNTRMFMTLSPTTVTPHFAQSVKRRASTPNTPQPKLAQKIKCRYFFEKGYCMRGDQCFYDHGSDLIVAPGGLSSDSPVGAMGDRSQSKPILQFELSDNNNNGIAAKRARSRSPLKQSPPSELPTASSAPIRRMKCRFFYEKGYCMRGDSCFYDHGADPVIIQQPQVDDVEYKPEYKPDAAIASATTDCTEGYNPESPSIGKTSRLSMSSHSLPAVLNSTA